MKSVLLFLAGLLIGANAMYFLMARDGRAGAAVPADVPTPAAPAAVAATPTRNAANATWPDTSGRSPLPTSSPALAPTSPSPAVGSLLIPVAGILPGQLTDTFDDARGGGSRQHEALDIMAARGTPVLAASDGKVAKLFTSVAGGLTIYEFDPTQTYAYYYAHLDRYAAGLVDGKPLTRGDVIGYVGSTGDASPEAPHLHFAIFLLGPEKRWWKGTAINPYPLLAAAR